MIVTSAWSRKKKSSFLRQNNFNAAIYTISTFGIIGTLAPYVHIFFSSSNAEGYFGFPDLETLLFCVGFPVLTISAGCLLFFSSKHVIAELKNVFKVFSVLFLFTGSFFLSWSLMPSVKDYDPIYYYTAMTLISIGGTIIFYYLNTALTSLNKKIESLISLIANIRTEHFFKLANKAHATRINSTELTDSISKLDGDINTTFKKF